MLLIVTCAHCIVTGGNPPYCRSIKVLLQHFSRKPYVLDYNLPNDDGWGIVIVVIIILLAAASANICIGPYCGGTTPPEAAA